MPKIIFTSRYLRDAPPEQLENNVRYVSTCEGVEKVEGSRDSLLSTAQQKDLTCQIFRDFPFTKEMLEYKDFLLRPTIGNALEFISCAMLHTGTGTERDDDVAAAYWERAAKLGNVYAQYALGKLWLETEGGDTVQAASSSLLMHRCSLAVRMQNRFSN